MPQIVSNWISDARAARFHVTQNGNVLLFGGNVIMLDKITSVPIVRFHDRVMIRLSASSSGAFISGEFFDTNRNVVATIESNKFTLNRANFFREIRPDKSTLTVVNNQNVEALAIRFCRTNLFSISGTFFFPDGTCAIATKTNCFYRGSSFYGQFFGGGDGGMGIDSNGYVVWGSSGGDQVQPRHFQ
jgi:hypothetical protein